MIQNITLASAILLGISSFWIELKEGSNVGVNNSVIEFKSAQNDSTFTIGFVNDFTFESDNEFYVNLQFKVDIEGINEYLKLAEEADSIIYADEENIRTRIPSDIAEHYFEFSGLEQLNIYSTDHELISTENIKRVEYHNQNLDSKFIAVFNSDKLEKGKLYYYVGNKEISRYEVASFEDQELTEKITNNFEADFTNYQSVTHYKQPNGSIISVLNSDRIVYIIESFNDESRIIYQSDEPAKIVEIIILPLLRNDRPVLLTKVGIPETDNVRESLLVYNGVQYVANSKQRLSTK